LELKTKFKTDNDGGASETILALIKAKGGIIADKFEKGGDAYLEEN